MMRPCSRTVFALLAIAGLAAPLTAQHLPGGEYHANRARQYDMLHYRAELSFDFAARRLTGRATIDLTPLHHLETISLDAIALDVRAVTEAATGTPLRYETKGQQLTIQPRQAVAGGDTLHLAISYTCVPSAGMYFMPDREKPGHYFVTTYGEDGLHANWLPIYNDVNDKFTSEMLVTVPDDYTVISNGRLIATTPAGDGLKTVHWRQEKPHANYLIAIYVGDFEKGTLPAAFGSIPIDFWVPRGRLKEGAYVFRNTPKMVEFFSERFNYRYPWVKYDQVAFPDYAIGAMEHTGVTGHRDNILRDAAAPLEFNPTLDDYYAPWTAESIISHELAHHWFGDNLTCRSLSHIWLNESFASYLMYLWEEKARGTDEFLFDLQFARRLYFDYVASSHIIRPLEYHYFDSANDIYNEPTTYLKGAAVLHMLRKAVGDDDFFRALSYYLYKHEFGNVESRDLKIAFEEATGRNLDWFFDDWITGGGHPIFEISAAYLRERKKLDLSVNQVQPIVEGQDLFTLPVRVKIVTAQGSNEQKLWIEDDSQHFLIDAPAEPLLVSFDGEGDLVAEIRFLKSPQELSFQAQNDAVPGRIRAIQQLAARYPALPLTRQTFESLLKSRAHWGVRAEAARQLSALHTAAGEELAALALQDQEYRVRKAAVLALPAFGTASAREKLRRVITSDKMADVVAAAVHQLAVADPEMDPAIIEEQLARKSWHDIILIGCLEAFAELRRPALAGVIKKYTAAAYNDYVRVAAFTAWEACAPDDGELHAALIAATQSPVYTLQQHAISALGRLHVARAAGALEAILAQNADANLVQAAEQALDTIQRVAGE